MINILNIYKFSFPFIKNKYEEVLFNSIFNDIKELLTYEETLENIIEKSSNNHKKISFIFKKWKIEILFNQNKDYYIPKFQLNLFLKEDLKDEIIIDIIKIIETFWIENYIFDYDKESLENLNQFKLKDIYYLKNNFNFYNEIKLNNFLKNINKDYLEEELKQNPIILNSFLYLIYISFNFYKNYINSLKSKKEIEVIKKKEISTEYLSAISLSETRLENISDLNLVTFKKYKKMLDVFFELLR